MAAEHVLYQDKDVTVTTARAIVRGTTYAMANVTSVRLITEGRPAAVAQLAILALACGMSCVVGNCADSRPVGLVETLVAGVLFAVYWFTKPKYWVMIGTAGAEANAIYSHDPKWTGLVVDAMNSAIVRRG